ncbi:hypothetical protein AB1Y20_013240 [Prymnesium parvum]|uniref:Anaphase-promoting complex subunit 1 n=1 Tax=Prymnesium parvum TaxID=97485 RepID=A0AB34IMV6_PRYPA|mmetsp:Transcript_8560/g.21142  ORF Transcript_8560/g.21142 Transcript_8560/m.21142 type:complete len:251 (+) Transcript_8560:49-801(+)
MVLSVPPLLEGVELGARRGLEQALAAWQGQAWGAAQRLRAKARPAPDHPRWMGTATQLSVAIGGSVVMGSADDEPVIIPLATTATPTTKSSPAGPLVRLEGPPSKTGRYALLSVIIGSSEGIWPAAITVGDRGGKDAHSMRASGGRPVALHVVASSKSRISFQLVDAATKAVLSASQSAEELALEVESGAGPKPWAEFLEGCLWGLPAATPAQEDVKDCVANGPHTRELAKLWDIASLGAYQRVCFLSAS